MHLPERLVFLISPPRSGSTLLAHLLSRHPRIHSQGEPWLMLALRQFGKIPSFHEYGPWHVAKATDEFFGERGDALIAGVARMLYGQMLAPEKSVFLDKTPRYYWIAPWLYSLFPDADFIILEREPLDMAASMKSVWNLAVGHDDIFSNHPSSVFDMLLAPESVRAFADAHADDPRVHRVTYEALVTDPAGTGDRLLERLGLAQEGPGSHWDEVDAARLSKGFGDPKIHQTDRVHTRSLGSGQTQLDADELAFLSAFYHGAAQPDDDFWKDRAALTRLKLEALLAQTQFLEGVFRSQGALAPAFQSDARDIERSIMARPAIAVSLVPSRSIGLPGPLPGLQPGETIEAGPSQRFGACLAAGWNEVEGAAVWSSGAAALLALRVSPGVNGAAIQISDAISDWRPDARFWVRLVGQGPAASEDMFALGREPVWKELVPAAGSDVVFIEIGCSDPFIPAERGFDPPDPRQLCVLLHAVRASVRPS